MFRRTTFLVSMLASLALAGITTAQNQPNPAQPGSMGQPGSIGRPDSMSRPSDPAQQLRQIAQDPKTAPDKLFVLMANCQSQFGEEISKQALQKATNPQVKQVAQRGIEDSQRAQQQLRPIAQQLGVQLPSDLQDDQRQVINILASLPTDQFEKSYMCGAESENAANLIRLRHVSQLSQNEQIRKFAQQQWSVASQRNDQIQQASAAVGLQSAPPEAVPAASRLEPGSSGINDINRPGNENESNRTGTGAPRP